MALMDLTIRQAIDVWRQLESAYRNENSYGGDTAEIYVYTLNPSSPLAVHGGGPMGLEAREEQAKNAADNLMELCAYFKKTHEDVVQINVDGKNFKTRLKDPIYHRVHVQIHSRKDQ